MNPEKIRDSIKSNPAGYIFLYLISYIYLSLITIKKFLFKIGFFKTKKFLKPVICVGNISTGGTGKTTFVFNIAKELSKDLITSAIVTRGYKSKYSRNEIVDINKIENFLNLDQISDEQKLLKVLLANLNIPVIAFKNRAKAIEYAINTYNPEVIIMDDGLQNFSIYKDLKIVLINLNRFNDSLLPLGNLRERYDAVKDVDFLILNHCELFDENYIAQAERFFRQYLEEDKIIRAEYEITEMIDIITGRRIKLNDFKQNFKEVAIFSGIGDNLQFKKGIEKIGVKVVKCWQFADHHNYSYNDLKSINELRGEIPVITTYKDVIKFISITKEIFKKDIYVADLVLKLSCQDFIKKIKEIIK